MTAGEKVDQINILCDTWIKNVEDLVLFRLQGESLSLRGRLLSRAITEIQNARKKCVAEAVSMKR
jgi:hypothetical protein